MLYLSPIANHFSKVPTLEKSSMTHACSGRILSVSPTSVDDLEKERSIMVLFF